MKTENDRCIERETKISHKVVTCLLDAGFSVSVFDGEEWAIEKSVNRNKIYKEMWSTDEDTLYACDSEGERIGWVSLIYGNDVDIISDYTTNLEDVLKPANDYADTL